MVQFQVYRIKPCFVGILETRRAAQTATTTPSPQPDSVTPDAMKQRGNHGAGSLRHSGLIWILLLTVAVLAPVAPIASFLGTTYTATANDVWLGVWILKAATSILAILGFVLDRMDPLDRDRAWREPPAPWLPVLGIAFLALALRTFRIDTELWLDEVEMLVRYVPLDLHQLVSTYDSQNHHPLYSILAHLTWLLGGRADWTVRIPAVLAGVAGVVALYRFGRRLVGERESLLAALVLAVSYHHIWFSQNARGYTLIMLFAVVGTGLFLRIASAQGRDTHLVWGYAIALALATYTHLTAAFIAVGHALALVVTADWRTARGRARALWAAVALGLSGILTIALYSLMLPQVLRMFTTGTSAAVTVQWTRPQWMVAESLSSLAGGIPGGYASLAVALSVLAIGAVSLWRRARLASLAMYLPVLITAAAVLATGHNLWPRFFFFAAGFLVLTAIRGGFALVHWAIRWHPGGLATAGALAVSVLSLITVPRAWQAKQQFQRAHDFVESQRRPGDEVVALDVAFHQYFLRGTAPTWYLTSRVELLDDVERAATRTWVVYTQPARLQTVTPEVWERLAPSRYAEVKVFPATVGGGEIHILRHDQIP